MDAATNIRAPGTTMRPLEYTVAAWSLISIIGRSAHKPLVHSRNSIICVQDSSVVQATIGLIRAFYACNTISYLSEMSWLGACGAIE